MFLSMDMLGNHKNGAYSIVLLLQREKMESSFDEKKMKKKKKASLLSQLLDSVGFVSTAMLQRDSHVATESGAMKVISVKQKHILFSQALPGPLKNLL